MLAAHGGQLVYKLIVGATGQMKRHFITELSDVLFLRTQGKHRELLPLGPGSATSTFFWDHFSRVSQLHHPAPRAPCDTPCLLSAWLDADC